MPLLIILISFIATLLSSMSGGGSAMITIPTWILLGYPLPVALAANQINGALWTPIAARNYLKTITIDWLLVGGLILFGLCGAYAGTQVVLQVDETVLQRIFGIVILMIVILLSFHQDFGVTALESNSNRIVSAILALPLGFYETFFGSGNGMFTSGMLIKTRGFVLTTALGYYYIISFTWCCLGALVYLREGFGNWWLVVPSSIGGMSGAYVGSLIGRQKGPEFVKKAFLLLGSVLGIKLTLGF